MKKYIALLLLLMVLTIGGCTKKEENNPSNDVTNEEKVSVSEEEAGEDKLALPIVDSSEEHFYIYSTDEREEIDQLLLNYGQEFRYSTPGTTFTIAYYDYYDMLDTKLPVVVGMSVSDAVEEFGGDWIPVKDKEKRFSSGEESFSYGIATVSQIIDMVNDDGNYVILARDDSVTRKTVDNVQPNDVYGSYSMERLEIYIYRKTGVVYLVEKDGEYFFESSMFDTWILY